MGLRDYYLNRCVLFTLVSQLMHAGYNPKGCCQHSGLGTGVGCKPLLWFAGLLAIILGVKLFFKTKVPNADKIGSIFLMFMGIGTITVSFFPTDIPGSLTTLTGMIHIRTAELLVVLFPAACLLMAPHMKKIFARKWISRYTHLAAGMSVALIIAVVVLVLGDHGFTGTLERLIMANGLTWVQLMHLQLL
jgi:hypothetical protein